MRTRSEEHTSELQSRLHLVCRLLLDTATTEIYTLSLHDALPIWEQACAVKSKINTVNCSEGNTDVRCLRCNTSLAASCASGTNTTALCANGGPGGCMNMSINANEIGRAHV